MSATHTRAAVARRSHGLASLGDLLPFVAEFSVALLVLLAFLVVGVFLFRLREHFDTLDLTGIETIERRGR